MKYTNFQDIPERMKAYYQIDVELRALADKNRKIQRRVQLRIKS